MKHIYLSIILVFLYSTAFSCSCGFTKKIPAEALVFEGIVFTGKIIDVELVYESGNSNKYPTERMATFMVENWFSSHDISDTVVVFTGIGGGDCGLPFITGETWLIYAFDMYGIIRSSICTSSLKSTYNSYPGAVSYLQGLKQKSGIVDEKLEWLNGITILRGELQKGDPVGKWLKIREKDTLAVFNFDNRGKRQGYQKIKIYDWDDPVVFYYETSDSCVRVYSEAKNLTNYYQIKDGKRNGIYRQDLSGNILVKANYKNGRLDGYWTSWHVDTALASGLIKTIRLFEMGILKSTVRFEEATGKKIE